MVAHTDTEIVAAIVCIEALTRITFSGTTPPVSVASFMKMASLKIHGKICLQGLLWHQAGCTRACFRSAPIRYSLIFFTIISGLHSLPSLAACSSPCEWLGSKSSFL
jgi:hypothetical protein